MAKVIVQHVCSECGTTTGRWLGKCPGCGAFGSLVEELSGQADAGAEAGRRRAHARAARRGARPRRRRRISTGVPELDRVLGGGIVPASLVLVGGEPGVGKSTLLLAALGNVSRAGRRALLVTGEESVAQVKLRADRLGGAEKVEILAETELESVCATLEQERPDVCVIDSVQTLYSAELGSAPGSVGPGARGGGPAAPRVQGAGRRDDPRRARDEGRLGRGPAGARAPRRLRAPVRGRPVPRPPHPAGGQEPVRLDERARRLRDDGRRARRRPGSLRALRPYARGEVGAAVACALEGTRPILLEIQALVSRTDLAMPRRVATGVDPKRLAMIVAVLSRHAGIALGAADVFVNVAGGVRIDEPGADLAVALAIASAARGVPVRDGIAVFGEIGLTGRLRPAAQAERRLEECAKLGLTTVIAPEGTTSRGGPRVTRAETLRQAIAAGLEVGERQRRRPRRA